MIDTDILVELGFTETTHREYFWSKKKTAYKYETTFDHTKYSLIVFESKGKIIVLSDMTGVGPFKFNFENIADAMEYITGRVNKWKAM